jgi:hypothetical protein
MKQEENKPATREEIEEIIKKNTQRTFFQTMVDSHKKGKRIIDKTFGAMFRFFARMAFYFYFFGAIIFVPVYFLDKISILNDFIKMCIFFVFVILDIWLFLIILISAFREKTSMFRIIINFIKNSFLKLKGKIIK